MARLSAIVGVLLPAFAVFPCFDWFMEYGDRYLLARVGAGVAPTSVVASDRCRLDDLYLPLQADGDDGSVLALGSGWTSRWTVTWSVAATEVVCPVRELTSVPIALCRPVRRFGWRPRQRHRPGLQFMQCTGRHHGFESMAEQRLLLALDFAGDLVDVVSQPFRLRFDTACGWRSHIPDFLAVTRNGIWLFDVRPAGRVGDDDRVCFAASAEAALAAGWRYAVVTGWQSHVMSTLDTLSSQRRELTDHSAFRSNSWHGLEADRARSATWPAATSLPAVARAYALHLLWHRRLGVDLAQPLTDGHRCGRQWTARDDTTSGCGGATPAWQRGGLDGRAATAAVAADRPRAGGRDRVPQR